MPAEPSVFPPKAVPIITCPECGGHLRLTTIMPEPERRQRMTFSCSCGFDYRQSSSLKRRRVD
jgi:hypothetical protein